MRRQHRLRLGCLKKERLLPNWQLSSNYLERKLAQPSEHQLRSQALGLSLSSLTMVSLACS